MTAGGTHITVIDHSNCSCFHRSIRVFLHAEPDLLTYFDKLANTDKLPTLASLLDSAHLLADQYTSQAATEHALSFCEATNPTRTNKIPEGSPWTCSFVPPVLSDPSAPGIAAAAGTDDAPEVHKEAAGFDGDRVLRNSELFLIDFGWWIEMAWAVPEGDIGRVFEILKVNQFSPSSNVV